MQNKLFVARTKTALKSRAELHSLNINDYYLIPINDEVRGNKVMKSLVSTIDNAEYKYMLIQKSFCVITNEGKLQVNTNMLSENAYAQDLNTPEEEIPGDKVVSEGTLKNLLSKVSSMELTDAEKETVTKALKSWGEHAGEEVPESEEFVDELEQKTVEAEDESDEAEAEAETKAFGESEDADEAEVESEDDAVTKSVKDRLAALSSDAGANALMANLKSFGSLSDDEAVFTSKAQARRFSQIYNSKVHGSTKRAEVAPAGRNVRQTFGTKAKFIVEVN